MIHSTADVKTAKVGKNTDIWQYTVILENAVIGNNCNINAHVFIENDVVIGNNVTVKCGVQLWNGLHIEDNVFIGPNVTFTNDERPRSKQYPDTFQGIKILNSASIGAGSIILGGVTIGRYAMTGAGTIVTKNVPDRALVVGSPGRIIGWLNKDGTKMKSQTNDTYTDNQGNSWKRTDGKIIKL